MRTVLFIFAGLALLLGASSLCFGIGASATIPATEFNTPSNATGAVSNVTNSTPGNG